jgi:oligopeptide transport system permease protein
MKKYIFKRVVIAVITVLVILLILYLMLDLMPGSPFNDEKMTAEQQAALYAKYGLNDPFPVRYLRYVRDMLKGDFGISYAIQKNCPISTMLKARVPISLRIGLQAAVFGTFVGLILGIVAAIKRNSPWDTVATTISVLGVSLPSFVFALLLSYLFSYKLKVFPLLYSTKEAFKSTILPTISLSMFTIASIARYSRSELIEVLNSEYILLADSKGITRTRLICTHALHNALIGVITVLAPLVVNLMTGSLVVEKAFSIPGIGSLYIKAIQMNDYNVTLSISFLYSVLFIFTMLLVDILYGIIDPRIRLAKEG